jgi:hypothetical protein
VHAKEKSRPAPTLTTFSPTRPPLACENFRTVSEPVRPTPSCPAWFLPAPNSAPSAVKSSECEPPHAPPTTGPLSPGTGAGT